MLTSPRPSAYHQNRNTLRGSGPFATGFQPTIVFHRQDLWFLIPLASGALSHAHLSGNVAGVLR